MNSGGSGQNRCRRCSTKRFDTDPWGIVVGDTRQARKGRIVIKQHVTGYNDVPIPNILVLGDADGFRWLASCFEAMAQVAEAIQRDTMWANRVGDLDDHRHVWTNEAPFIHEVSDLVEFRMGALADRTIERVLEYYDIDARSASHGDIRDRMKEWARLAGNLDE